MTEIDATIRAAEPMGMRDVLFQANHLAVAALTAKGDEGQAIDRSLVALSQLEAMRAGLEGDLLAHFLARPSIVAFAKNTGDFLRDAGRSDEEARLRSALSTAAAPSEPG